MKYLEGDQIPITTESLKKIIGKRVQYLSERDIDKSGRGYHWPRVKTVQEIYRRQVIFDDYDSVSFSQLREIVLFTNKL